jgi:hypothetical protein
MHNTMYDQTGTTAEPPVRQGGGGGAPLLPACPRSPPRPEVEEEEGKGGWRKKTAAGAPVAASAGLATWTPAGSWQFFSGGDGAR